jgi:hypothetical protein
MIDDISVAVLSDSSVNGPRDPAGSHPVRFAMTERYWKNGDAGIYQTGESLYLWVYRSKQSGNQFLHVPHERNPAVERQFPADVAEAG